MQKLSTKLEGPLLLAPVVYGDQRGFFLESFRQSVLDDLGLEAASSRTTIPAPGAG